MERNLDQTDWHGKPYYSVDAYCKNTYGEKLYKIAVNTGLGCPNRDGLSGTGGCIFCSAGGSGDFAVDYSLQHSISDQLQTGITFFHNKKIGNRFIAYFQAYTNTYAPAEVLQPLPGSACRANRSRYFYRHTARLSSRRHHDHVSTCQTGFSGQIHLD